MVELVYCGTYMEFQEYVRLYNKVESRCKYIREAHDLNYVPEGSEIKVFGSYSARMDYGQASEISKRRRLNFRG